MANKPRLDKAARQLADLIEGHLSGLSPSERDVKSRAFHKALAKIGTRAKSEEPPQALETRPVARRHA